MPPLSLSDIPTLTKLYRTASTTLLGASTDNTKPLFKPSQSHNDTISLLRTDITTLKVDAIVNAANARLLGGGGVDGAIHRAAGPDLIAECKTLHGCDTGSAKITAAYHLPCKRVIHAVGPVYNSVASKRNGGNEKLLAGCYQTALELAKRESLKSIAFSALSTGIYGYPSDEAAQVALDVTRKFLDQHNGAGFDRVVFCNFTDKDEAAYEAHVRNYFPPTVEDEKNTDGKDAGESLDALAQQLPDPPTEDPKAHETSDKKRQRHDADKGNGEKRLKTEVEEQRNEVNAEKDERSDDDLNTDESTPTTTYDLSTALKLTDVDEGRCNSRDNKTANADADRSCALRRPNEANENGQEERDHDEANGKSDESGKSTNQGENNHERGESSHNKDKPKNTHDRKPNANDRRPALVRS